MLGADPRVSVAENYRRFARGEVHGKSPLYEELCDGIADDSELLEFLVAQPPEKRQPNLLLGVVRVLFGRQSDYASFRTAVLEHRDLVTAELSARRTQTNEPGRCAVLLPLLATLPQPLALLEVGAAAGLCLLVDRYGYDYDGHRVGSTELVFPCSIRGNVPLPRDLPQVAWRAGIDISPIDLHDQQAVRWLETLVWPEETDRLERLRAAIAIARTDPPRIIQADLLDALASLASQAPRDATLVIFHTAVLPYLTRAQRDQFQTVVATLGAEWIANEGAGVLAHTRPTAASPWSDQDCVVTHNQQPVAFCDPHGRWIQWIDH